MMIDLVLANKVDGIREVGVVVGEEHDDVMKSDDTVEDSGCLSPERTHLGKGSMDMSFSSCKNALG